MLTTDARRALVALVLTTVCAIVAARAGAQSPPLERYARPELLVSADWLAAHTSDPNVRIVDLRTRGYEDGHIPGAMHLANAEIRQKAPPTFLPTVAAFEALRAASASRTERAWSPTTIAADSARLWWTGLLRPHERRAPRRRLRQWTATVRYRWRALSVAAGSRPGRTRRGSYS
jgi:rhodanese-related sulfurtransferase